MPVMCRDASEADIATICLATAELALMVDYGQTAGQLTQVLHKAFQRREPIRVVGQNGGPIQGLTWFLPRGGLGAAAYLRLLLVSPAAQNRGVGSALVEDFERLCCDAPGGYLALTSEKNEGARRFYRRLNYQEVGLLPHFVRGGLNECLLYKQRIKA